jgi:hypothetical protein
VVASVALATASLASREVLSQTGAWQASSLPRIAEVVNGTSEISTIRGRPAVHLLVDPARRAIDTTVLAMLDRPTFTDGTIEVPVIGVPRADAPRESRGFVGVSFRTGARGEWTEVFYLRPLNARANDQLRRNHTVQYASDPEFPWHRLREEQPGRYESYADMTPGEWTTMRIVVSGTTARLFVNGAAQPCLVVTDLKHGSIGGRIALWAHAETDAYFGPVSVMPP